MKNKKSTIFSFCLLLLLCWSCENPVATPELVAPRPALDTTCIDGLHAYFDLQPIPSGERRINTPVAHRVDVSSNPYTTGDCLCKLKKLRFEFSNLPNETMEYLIQVEDSQENGVEFEVNREDFGNNDAVIIRRPGNIPDSGMDVYIWVDIEEYDPGFVRATGLCIIDNLQGTDPDDPTIPSPNVTLTIPLKIPTSGSNNGQPYFKAYIPESITYQ